MEGIWFNDDKPRRIWLRSAVLLVGKAPTKQKTIKMMCTMYLDGGGEEQLAGLPEWLGAARDFVMKNGEQITASHVVKQVNIVMGEPNLFKKKPIEAPHTQLDHFVIKQIGKSDEPDTVLTLELRTPFSTDVWKWCGQQGGLDFDITFELVGEEQTPTTDVNAEAEADASDGEDDPDDPGGRKLLADATAKATARAAKNLKLM
jgi:hypothetical protein